VCSELAAELSGVPHTGESRSLLNRRQQTVAKQERVRISQRVRAGLDVARAKGRRLGRPKVVVDVAGIANLRAQGRSWRNITEELGIGKGTAQRALAGLPKNV
jgi:DNA invertase Pin-like site-specific DNA recombinase